MNFLKKKKTQFKKQTEGRIAAGGNINLSNVGVGSAYGTSTSCPSLLSQGVNINNVVAGKKVTWGGGRLFSGQIVFGDSASIGGKKTKEKKIKIKYFLTK